MSEHLQFRKAENGISRKGKHENRGSAEIPFTNAESEKKAQEKGRESKQHQFLIWPTSFLLSSVTFEISEAYQYFC